MASDDAPDLGFDDVIHEHEILYKTPRLDIHAHDLFDRCPSCPGDGFHSGRGDVAVDDRRFAFGVHALLLTVSVGNKKKADQDTQKHAINFPHDDRTSSFCSCEFIY